MSVLFRNVYLSPMGRMVLLADSHALHGLWLVVRSFCAFVRQPTSFFALSKQVL